MVIEHERHLGQVWFDLWHNKVRTLLAVIVAIVGGLGLMGSLFISVVERTKEIGVLRAVGARSGTITGMFVMEGLLQGVFSWVVVVVISTLASILPARSATRVSVRASLAYI